MARYKYIDTQPKLIPVDLAAQLLPGTFEHALNHLLDHAVGLSHFDARFRNDDTGAPAYPPALLLKVVLFAYSQGIVSSRQIARACQEHITVIALCGDQAPHFTTIAKFVSTLGDDSARVFAAVLAVCDAQGLIGRELFAIDGVRLPSNASKHRSGTRADFERQAAKLEAAATTMLQRHRATDDAPTEPDPDTKAAKRVARLEKGAAQIRDCLTRHPDDRRGAKGSIRKSNRTDNESAKMATSTGVIQRYTGVAAADAGYHREANLRDKSRTAATQTPHVFTPAEFTYDAGARTCICPAGKSLYRKGARNITKGLVGEHSRGAKRDSVPCALRTQCLRTPHTTQVRNVAFFAGRADPMARNYTAEMKVQLDTPNGRRQYGERFAAGLKPVLARGREHPAPR